uniref:Defensin-like protein n=1 Tax=Kalanchoe fedtschenkoi TaxID=63787 RepID=A0A7N0T9E5_KALFE
MCTEGMGVICRSDCNALCNQKHPGGQGFCDGIWPHEMCSCSYPCGPPDPPGPPDRNCRGGGGACDACGDSCCSQRCGSKFQNGVGYCEYFSAASLCACLYTC